MCVCVCVSVCVRVRAQLTQCCKCPLWCGRPYLDREQRVLRKSTRARWCAPVHVCVCNRCVFVEKTKWDRFFGHPARPGKFHASFLSGQKNRWLSRPSTVYFSVHYMCVGMCVSACWLVAGRSWAEKKYPGPTTGMNPPTIPHPESESASSGLHQMCSLALSLNRILRLLFSTLLSKLKTWITIFVSVSFFFLNSVYFYMHVWFFFSSFVIYFEFYHHFPLICSPLYRKDFCTWFPVNRNAHFCRAPVIKAFITFLTCDDAVRCLYGQRSDRTAGSETC